jgi:hypothetical protein
MQLTRPQMLDSRNMNLIPHFNHFPRFSAKMLYIFLLILKLFIAIRQETENTMFNRKGTKRQAIVDKTLH